MKHKRGDTFDVIATVPQNIPDGYFAGWEVASQIRDPNNRLVADLVAVWADDTTPVSEPQPSKPYLQQWSELVQTWQERLTPMPQTH